MHNSNIKLTERFIKFPVQYTETQNQKMDFTSQPWTLENVLASVSFPKMKSTYLKGTQLIDRFSNVECSEM